jgi:hypothetical protein
MESPTATFVAPLVSGLVTGTFSGLLAAAFAPAFFASLRFLGGALAAGGGPSGALRLRSSGGMVGFTDECASAIWR